MSEQTQKTNSSPTDEKVHNHAEEVQNSRPQSNSVPRSNSNLGPIRSRAGTPSRTGTPDNSSVQNAPQDIPRVSRLLPSVDFSDGLHGNIKMFKLKTISFGIPRIIRKWLSGRTHRKFRMFFCISTADCLCFIFFNKLNGLE